MNHKLIHERQHCSNKEIETLKTNKCWSQHDEQTIHNNTQTFSKHTVLSLKSSFQ